jgi:predicted lactoylglutathione lyase
MLGYCILGTNDLITATAFYDEILALFGARHVMEHDRGVFYGVDTLALGLLMPANGKEATVGNGSMVALQASSRQQVDEVYAKALKLGGAGEGEPGVRGPDPDGFYGAYFRDREGNKLCVYHFGMK